MSKILEITTTDSSSIKTLIDVLKDVIEEANIEFYSKTDKKIKYNH